MDVELAKIEGLAVARLSGTAKRYGSGRGQPGEDPVAELHKISTDPRLLGIAGGADLLHAAGGDRHAAAAVELLRQAGADEQVLQAQAEVVRRRLARPRHEAGGGSPPTAGQPPPPAR